MRWIALALLMLCFGCRATPQPESARTVAAFEVHLRDAKERAEFLALLTAAAEAEGLHVDASSEEELEVLSEVAPITIHAAVWRGINDDEAVASVAELPDNSGRAWIAFFRGEDPRLATRFRTRAMRQISARWPTTQSLPVMPTGSIPLPEDLRLTPEGYRVKPEAAHRYELAPSSPLIARN